MYISAIMTTSKNSDTMAKAMRYMSDPCNTACGMHKYELMDPYVCSIDIGIINSCLLSIIDMFAGLNTKEYTLDRRRSYVFCDGSLDACICPIEEAIDSEIKNSPGYIVTEVPELDSMLRHICADRVSINKQIVLLCIYWDRCRMVYTPENTTVYTYSDAWLEEISKEDISLDEIEKLIMTMETCELVNSDVKLDMSMDI